MSQFKKYIEKIQIERYNEGLVDTTKDIIKVLPKVPGALARGAVNMVKSGIKGVFDNTIDKNIEKFINSLATYEYSDFVDYIESDTYDNHVEKANEKNRDIKDIRKEAKLKRKILIDKLSEKLSKDFSQTVSEFSDYLKNTYEDDKQWHDKNLMKAQTNFLIATKQKKTNVNSSFDYVRELSKRFDAKVNERIFKNFKTNFSKIETALSNAGAEYDSKNLSNYEKFMEVFNEIKKYI